MLEKRRTRRNNYILDSKIASIVTQNEDVKLLMTLTGIDYSALLNVSKICDNRRFPSPKHLVSWIGLCPSIDRSGNSLHVVGGIKKDSNKRGCEKMVQEGRRRPLPIPQKILGHVVAVDETKLKILRGKQVFIWSAVDLKRYYDVPGLKVSAARGELDAILFLKEILRNTAEKEERPLILVDHGPWYPPALEHPGVRYKQVIFQNRNSVQ
jgi:hypothetical protein